MNVFESAVLQLCPDVAHFDQDFKWTRMRERTIFKELIACCLGNQVSYEHALSATNQLDAAGYLSAKALKTWGDDLPHRINDTLSTNSFKPLRLNGEGRRFRYPKIGTKCIMSNLSFVYKENKSLKTILTNFPDATIARKSLSKTIFGMGPKQSSLFLRNIGFSDMLAVLDRHVLSYMSIMGLLDEQTSSVSSLQKYERLEERLSNYASYLGENLQNLDLSIWVVMRVAKKEKYIVGRDSGIWWT